MVKGSSPYLPVVIMDLKSIYILVSLQSLNGISTLIQMGES